MGAKMKSTENERKQYVQGVLKGIENIPTFGNIDEWLGSAQLTPEEAPEVRTALIAYINKLNDHVHKYEKYLSNTNPLPFDK